MKVIKFNRPKVTSEEAETMANVFCNKLIENACGNQETIDIINNYMRFEYAEFVNSRCAFYDNVKTEVLNIRPLTSGTAYQLMMYCADARDVANMEYFYKNKVKKDPKSLLDTFEIRAIEKGFEDIKGQMSEGKSLWAALHPGEGLMAQGTMNDVFMIHPERKMQKLSHFWNESEEVLIEEKDGDKTVSKTVPITKELFYNFSAIKPGTPARQADVKALKHFLLGCGVCLSHETATTNFTQVLAEARKNEPLKSK